MKRKWIITFITSLITFGGIVVAAHFWRGELMSTSKVCKLWGESPFNATLFKNGSMIDRQKMACTILKHPKPFIGKSRLQIRELLGDHNGFYFSDMFPAYIIESKAETGGDTWQILFFLDRQQLVNEVAVHKNCCDR